MGKTSDTWDGLLELLGAFAGVSLAVLGICALIYALN